MATARLLILACLLLFIQPLFAQNWYKGNLHTHSLWSDGDDYPEMIMDWYLGNGYQFVGLSDHNILQDGEKWVTVPKVPVRRQVFERYLRNFGEEWVDYRKLGGDTLQVRLKTLEEYRGMFEQPGAFLILRSEEITSGLFGRPVHINATNVQRLIPPQQGRSITEVIQKTIDAVAEQRKATGQPMFPHINHPNFGWAITAEDIMDVRGERFFEVYNGHPAVNNYGDSTRLGTEAMWDRINLHYLRQGQPLLLGLATDDCHNYYYFGPRYSNAGRGWVMVNAPELTPASLIEAMEAGRFYASTGVNLDYVSHDAAGIYLKVREETQVKYTIQFVGCHEGETETRVLQTSTGPDAAYRFKGTELFVRARIVSDKPKFNPYFPGETEMAWIQPVVVQSSR